MQLFILAYSILLFRWPQIIPFAFSQRSTLLFESHIYLIAQRDDPLAALNLISEEDLYGRTLMVGGGSPPALKAVQHRSIATGKIDYFNSADHDTTLTNVAAGTVCLDSFRLL